MDFTTKFAIGEVVNLIISKKKDAIGKITSISINEYMDVVYSVQVKYSSDDCHYNRIFPRTDDELRHMNIQAICVAECYYCSQMKPIVFEKSCKNCLNKVLQNKKGLIKEMKHEIENNKRRLLSGVLKEKCVIDAVFNQIYRLMGDIKEMERDLDNIRMICG